MAVRDIETRKSSRVPSINIQNMGDSELLEKA